MSGSGETVDEETVDEQVDTEVIEPSTGSMIEVAKITGEKVKEAAGLMKSGKADVTGGYSSDAILNGPDILFDKLAAVFRSWCVHGNVTPSLLACAFLPLLKSALKDPSDPGS